MTRLTRDQIKSVAIDASRGEGRYNAKISPQLRSPSAASYLHPRRALEQQLLLRQQLREAARLLGIEMSEDDVRAQAAEMWEAMEADDFGRPEIAETVAAFLRQRGPHEERRKRRLATPKETKAAHSRRYQAAQERLQRARTIHPLVVQAAMRRSPYGEAIRRQLLGRRPGRSPSALSVAVVERNIYERSPLEIKRYAQDFGVNFDLLEWAYGSPCRFRKDGTIIGSATSTIYAAINASFD